MVAVPGKMPDTIPAPVIGAVDGSLLFHDPPANELVSVMLLAWQTVPEPAIAAGMAFTVDIVVAKQPSIVV